MYLVEYALPLVFRPISHRNASFEPRCHKHTNPYRASSGLRNHFESMLKQAGTGDRTGRRGEEARLHDLNLVFHALESQLPRNQTTVPPETQPRKSNGVQGRSNCSGLQSASKRSIVEPGIWEGKIPHTPPVNHRGLGSRLKTTSLVM